MALLDESPGSDGPATRIFNGPAELGRGVVLGGRYEVARVLGEGGIGVVVAATDITTGRRVALKFLQPEAARDADVRTRFQREAQAASAIACDHVVRVFDVGTLDSGAPFIVMELLEGDDLATVLERRGPLPVDEVVDHVLEALVAIGLAHQRGIAHRDLKPANLFLTHRPDGGPIVKVLDFGLSKSAPGKEDLALTKTSHASVGTPLYMAPEQIRSLKSASYASDVWAIGVILFELASGQLPFDGESLGALFAAISADPPRRLEEVLPSAPPALSAAIARCLAKRPTDRPASVAALAASLAPLAGPRGRAAFARLQQESGSGSGAHPGGPRTDEPSVNPAGHRLTPPPGTVGEAWAAPTKQIALSSDVLGAAGAVAGPVPGMGPTLVSSTGIAPRSVAPAARRSSLVARDPRTGRRGGAVAAAITLALLVGGASWWLARQVPTVQADHPTIDAAERSVGPSQPTDPLVVPSAEAPAPRVAPTPGVDLAPSAADTAPGAPRPAGRAPVASAAPAPSVSVAASSPPTSRPRQPPPPASPPPSSPPTASPSLDDVIKKGRR